MVQIGGGDDGGREKPAGMLRGGDRGGPVGMLRGARQSQQAAFVELLFDVVFVFAFTRFSQRLSQHLDWHGFYSTSVLLLALWWVWYRMAWTTNRYDPERPVIQIMVIVTMLATLLMAAALPTALHDRGAIFAPIFVTVQVVRHAVLLLVRGNRDAQLVSLRILFWAALSALPWLAGVAVSGNARLALWTVAVLVDYAGGAFDFPTPRLGRAGLRGQRVAAEHLTERYRQVLIVALGETILLSGLEFSPFGFDRDRTATVVVAFVITVLLWQIYFYRAGALLPAAIAGSRAPAFVGELASYSHLVMAAGLSLSAVGDKLVISQPLGQTTFSWTMVIAGGAAVFLVGRAMLDYAAFSRVSWSRPIGVLLLGAAVPVELLLPPLAASGVTALVLAGIAISNTLAWRLFPRRPQPPVREGSGPG